MSECFALTSPMVSESTEIAPAHATSGHSGAHQGTFNTVTPKAPRLPLLTQLLSPVDSSKTLLEVRHLVQEVQKAVKSEEHLSAGPLALLVCAELTKLRHLTVRTFADGYLGDGIIPPGWLEGVVLATSSTTTETSTIFVDCGFRAKFLIARPTSRYATYLQLSVPSIFVGTQKILNGFIDDVTRELHLSLRENGMAIPPWRTPSQLKDMYTHCLTAEIALRPSSSPSPPPRDTPQSVSENTEGELSLLDFGRQRGGGNGLESQFCVLSFTETHGGTAHTRERLAATDVTIPTSAEGNTSSMSELSRLMIAHDYNTSRLTW